MKAGFADRDDDSDLDDTPPRPRFVSHTEFRMPFDATPPPPSSPPERTMPSSEPPEPPDSRTGHLSDAEAVSVATPSAPHVPTPVSNTRVQIFIFAGAFALMIVIGLGICFFLQGLPQHAH